MFDKIGYSVYEPVFMIKLRILYRQNLDYIFYFILTFYEFNFNHYYKLFETNHMNLSFIDSCRRFIFDDAFIIVMKTSFG